MKPEMLGFLAAMIFSPILFFAAQNISRKLNTFQALLVVLFLLGLLALVRAW